MPEIDPYLAMGPLHASADVAPATPAPAAAPDDTDDLDDEVEDFSLPLAAPEREEEGDEGDDAAGDDEGEVDDDDQTAWLIERAEKADEYERELARIKAQDAEARAVAYWDQRLDKANIEFQRRRDVIFENAEQSLNPVGYLRQEMPKLENEANSWYAAYRDEREQALWQFAHAQAIPNHAARVVEHYKLPKEAINDLLEYAPELMEREAQKMRARLIKERKQAKQIDQLRRKASRLDIEANPLTTGTGRAASGKAFAEMSDDERYHAIPWTRAR